MMKKTYTQPTQKIVLLKSRAHILTGSDYKVNNYVVTDEDNVGDTDLNVEMALSPSSIFAYRADNSPGGAAGCRPCSASR